MYQMIYICKPSEVGWAPSEVICPPSEVLVIGFWSGASMIHGVLDRLTVLCWICLGLGLGRCLLRELLCCVVAYFCQCFECLCVPARTIFLLVL